MASQPHVVFCIGRKHPRGMVLVRASCGGATKGGQRGNSLLQTPLALGPENGTGMGNRWGSRHRQAQQRLDCWSGGSGCGLGGCATGRRLRRRDGALK